MAIEALKISNSASCTTFGARAPKAHNKAKKENHKERDILHDTPLRYTGYCDDIGAAIRTICCNSKSAFIRRLPVLSFIPVGLYIGADVTIQYKKTKEAEGKEMAKKKAASQAIFQGLTSLLFPIGIVAAGQKVAGKAFDKFIPKLRQEFTADGKKIINHNRGAALAVAGVATLIAVSKIADNFAEKFLMEKIFNPLLGLNKDGAKTPAAQGIKTDKITAAQEKEIKKDKIPASKDESAPDAENNFEESPEKFEENNVLNPEENIDAKPVEI